MSRLSELLTKYEKAINDAETAKKELVNLLGGNGVHWKGDTVYTPQGMIGGLAGTATFSTSAGGTHSENWSVKTIKYGKRRDNVLSYIKTHYGEFKFSIQELLSSMGGSKHDKYLNSQAVMGLHRSRKLRRVSKGVYKLTKGGK